MTAATPARFITLEGGEGAGKSTQAKILAAALEARGIRCVLTREPGGSPGAEDIRKLLVRGEQERWGPLTETLLLFAARADHIAQTILPALADGQWVICDRFIDSTYAYQGVGRKLQSDVIKQLEIIVLGGLRPDLTLILDVPPGIGLARTSGRALPLFDPDMATTNQADAQTATRRAREEARFERFGKTFHNELRNAFREIAAREPGRCLIIDATRTQNEVAEEIWKAATRRFGL